MKDVIIELGALHSLVKMKSHDGNMSSKEVSTAELIQSLNENYSISFHNLPKGIVSFSYNGNDLKVAIVVEEEVRSINYVSSRDKTKSLFSGKIVTPRALLMIYLKGSAGSNLYKIANEKFFAVVDDEITEETTLYRYPFNNAFNGGNICWGNVFSKGSRPSYELSKVGKWLDYFFSTNFVSDVSPGRNSSFNYKEEYHTLGTTEEYYGFLNKIYKDNCDENGKLTTKERLFPYDILSVSTQGTFKDVYESVFFN